MNVHKATRNRPKAPQIGVQTRRIRKAYRAAMRQAIKTPAQEWLCDNAYLLLQAAADARAGLRHTSRSDASRIAQMLEKCYTLYNKRSDVWTQETLTADLCAESPDSVQVQMLPAILRAVCVRGAVDGLQQTDAIAKAVRSLRALAEMDFDAMTDTLSPIERILRQDPCGAYGRMDAQTRQSYRQYLLRLARRRRQDPLQTAQSVLERAQKGTDVRTRHVGTYLLPAYPRRRGAFFLLLEALIPPVLCVLYGVRYGGVLVPVLLLFPVWALTAWICTRLSMWRVRPRRLPRMEASEIPPELQTLITVSTLLPHAEKAPQLSSHLEQLYLSNGDANTRVCLLADLRSAGTPEMPEDPADIAACRRIITQLNERYGGGFMLAVRPRVYAPTEGNYAGWERKRGAITQLVRQICGEAGSFSVLCGDTAQLAQTRYLLALDADTLLPLHAAQDMLCAAAHPLNRPVIDRKRGIVTAGYGVLAPRVCVEHTSQKTLFQRIFGGSGGWSMYDSVVSERYQDLFGESIFAGKGLIDVQAFHAVLDHALPEGRVLSHDSLEGGFLRCGYLSDVQVSDGFPQNQSSYLARMRRWVRGDWQNVGFLFSRNPLTALSRFKLWDNLRRSLTPVVCWMALFVCMALPQPDAQRLASVCLLCVCAEPFAAAVRSLCMHGFASLSRLFDCGAVPSALGSLLRGAAQLFLLPLQGLSCLCSIVQALYRSCRHKRTLEWTTFAETDAQNGKRRMRMQCLFTAAVGAVLFLSGRPMLRLAAVLFLMDIPFLLLSGKADTPHADRLSPAGREKLTSYAAAMWQYFAQTCDFRNNYLPPDNVQETPVYRVAQRTSPTNIGMMLLCILAARDFGWIDTQQMCARLQRSIASVEQLETVRGNLLNWYDTQTLRPLEPRYLSSVDCGNFLCALTALQQGVEEYAPQCPALYEVSQRIRALIDKADLTVFYNEKRKLFHIGLDPQTQTLSPSYYDLLMSEARMTGYYAIASGAVPKKHWAALSRAMCRSGRYVGPVSWTGSTFEYFMPFLFLPAPEGTLGAEALHFCLRCQKKRMRSKPFGISESGFYAFDRDFNYQYKAHGVQTLGLRRELDTQTVIAPYASFLMMQLRPQTMLRNLERLEKMQMTGRWGFYEAVDLTSSRTCGRPYAVVRSYMAHHVGMSLLAADNVLHDGVMRRRFMRDTRMRAAVSLLEEGVPTDAPIFKKRADRETPTPRERIEPHRREIVSPSVLMPHARVWTNGELSVCCADSGISQSVYRGVSLFRHSRDPLSQPSGPMIVLQGEGEAIPFAPMAGYRAGTSFRCAFLGTEMRYLAVCRDIQLRVRVRVHPETAALHYAVSVRNNRRQPFSGSVLVYAEPSLTAHRQAQSHPAFAKLFLEDTTDAQTQSVLFCKRERDGGQGVCMAAGLHPAVPHTCSRAKAAVLRTGYGVSSLLSGDVQLRDMPGSGDACLALQIPIQAAARGSAETAVCFTVASSPQEALDKLLRIRREGMRKGAGSLFGDGNMEQVLTERLLPSVVFGVREPESRRALYSVKKPLRTLWKCGVSGEDPVLFFAPEPQQDASAVTPYLRAVQRLRLAGFACDLLIGYDEADVYDAPMRHAIERIVREVCGAPEHAGGVHMVDLRGVSSEERDFLRAVSVLPALLPEPDPPSVTPQLTGDVQPDLQSDKLFAFTDRAIRIPKNRKTPYLPWCLVLSNAAFGTMVSDKALGFTWAFNAHEMQLTPWRNDPAADNRGECLLLRVNGETLDMLRCASAVFSPESARWYGHAHGVSFCVEVTVPRRAMCKHCTVTLRARQPQSVQVIYAAHPVLGGAGQSGEFVRAERRPDGVLLTSPDAPVHGYAFLGVQGGADVCITERSALWTADARVPDVPFAAAGKTVQLDKAPQTVHFSLSFALREEAARQMPMLSAQPEKPAGSIRVQSADPSFDRMVNTWLPWQIRSCRIEGRTGFYQCGGAWGFRDQLQDAAALLYTQPALARRQILRCAAVQFSEGDVLHWWHRLPRSTDALRGVRTRYRDDLLWLPWLTGLYVRVTGDASILETQVPYLQAEPLSARETERYFAPMRGDVRESVREHCLRAVNLVLQKGPHGLLLIGGGDWNDGFDRIGLGGKGESVWLSMFMIRVLQVFLPYCTPAQAQRYRDEMHALTQAIESAAWDGDHYLRAFLDDGTPIGSKHDDECRIDSVAQSFSVFAGLPRAHASLAVQTASEMLTDRKKGIVKLLDPPFTAQGKQVGYITAYPPGIRENGGQYTHAAVWLCAARILSGCTEDGYAMFRMLNPAYFCEDADRARLYGGEPYALAGDIPAAERSIACTGWSLYTGSAAWMYRTAVEVILGLHIENGKVLFQPHVPRALAPLRAQIAYGSTKICVEIVRENAKELCENGKIISCIPLDGCEHDVKIL